ncbi:TPR repeat [Desulfovibrio sp. DV]|uniref:tetratricopeptide repeat protein n=1 Tax=Desulfovibrio sp. DV TaxID=1844708 RepID=UPI000964EE7C|nr:tetratricopeptide repeat protein [Desulfovibrio sp. DV]OLN25424.1 TPR repeat [Desulfovibrio sp. DV]
MHLPRALLFCLVLAALPVPLKAASVQDRLFVGTEALLRGRYELASQTFAEALAADPENPYARTRLALALAGSGQADRARAELEKSLAARSDDLFALWSLGCLDLLAGRPTAAAGRFAAMDKADPGNLRSVLGLALAALQDGRTAEGIKLLAKVQQAEAGDALIRLLTGYAYWSLDAPANARLELEATLELEPRNTAALELLGLVYRRQGKADLAASAWGQALAIDPKSPGARFFLSRLAEDEGLAATLADRPAEARRAYERALAADPGNAAAAKALGLGVPQPTAPPAAARSPSNRPDSPTDDNHPARSAVARDKGEPGMPREAGERPKKKNAKAPAAPAEVPTPGE